MENVLAMIKKTALTVLFVLLSVVLAGFAGEPAATAPDDTAPAGDPLTYERFIRLAAEKDTEFDQILIDRLDLKYQKKLLLPAPDLVLSVKDRLVAFLDEKPSEEKGETSVTLSKLFPGLGTELGASYDMSPNAGAEGSSTFSFSLAQPIAENAFGRSTRLLDRIVGLEVDIAAHQIAEAYEDYLAAVSLAYLDWHEAYENLLIGTSSYKENLKLLDNIKEREKSRIALPIDVNKITLQVMSKKEQLVAIEEAYYQRLNIVRTILRAVDGPGFVPARAGITMESDRPFEEEFAKIRSGARTYRILDLLEEKSSVELDREADDLLPSINFLFQIDVDGKDFAIERKERTLFAGFSADWPFPDVVEQAEYETAKINLRRTELSTANTHERLYTQLKNLYREIRKEMKLIGITEEKITLARAVLEDEAENYRFGKSSLNDYIQAVNTLDNNRFNLVEHELAAQKLIIEFRRLSDRLVSEEDLGT